MRRAALWLCVFLAATATGLLAGQSGPLTIVSTGPNGDIRQLQDANEIRVTFSEPMVALGRIPSNPVLPWFHITPEIKGALRWSGTTTLIFTPDPAAPLPYSTPYQVVIDAEARSAAGKSLERGFVFTFTTPPPLLESARWYRRGDRFDQPAILILDFNQPMRAEDVAAHVTVRYRPHDIQIPEWTPQARARVIASDPAGMQRYEEKAAAARNTAARQDVVAVHVTPDWDRARFRDFGERGDRGNDDDRIALETNTVPPPGAYLEVIVDTALRGLQGPATPRVPQASTVELDPVFFAGVECTVRCDPSGYNGVELTVPVAQPEMRKLSVRDVTNAPPETPVAQSASRARAELDSSPFFNVEDAGFPRQPPATTWVYQLPPTLLAQDGQTLDYPWLAVVNTRRENAFTSFGDGHGVWETGGGPLPFSSRNFTTITQWIAPLAPRDLMPRILAQQSNGFEETPPGPGTLRRLPVTPDAIQAHGLDLAPRLSPAGTGLFWLGMKKGDRIPNADTFGRDATTTIVQVTNLGISIKDSPDSTLVFVTRLDNGEAVSGAAITIVDKTNTQLWRGITGNDGVALAPALSLRKPGRYEPGPDFIVTAEKNGDLAYAASDWDEGIEPWMFNLHYDLFQANDMLRGSVFTDRGVYKPGEEVHVKVIARSDTTKGMKLLAAGSKLDIRIRDSRNKEVDARTVTVNSWSSAEWTWTVPDTGALGSYYVQAAMPGAIKPEGNDVQERVLEGNWLKQISGSFLVAAYRKPEFRVDTTLTSDRPVAGGTLSASLDARYLFGNAMSQRPVRWSLMRSMSLDVPDAIEAKFPADRYAFGYYPRGNGANERVAGGTETVNAAGRFVTTLPSTRGDDFAYRYTFEGDVEDVSRQHVASQASTVVHPAPWYVGLRRPAYFANTTSGTAVDVVAADLTGQTVPGVTVKLELIRIQYNSVRRAEGSGFYTWDTERIEQPAGTWTVTTTTSPVNLPIPVPDGGSYLLRATAGDDEGHSTRTEVSFYGLGAGYTAWERFDHNRIQLEPEKKTWKPGDTARLMIQSPWESATALLTVEREGIRRYERFQLTSTQQTVQVPVSEADIPNVFVSVLLIRGRTSKDVDRDGNDPGKPAFRLGYAELLVEDATKKLKVQLTADREEYRPANKARVSVAITDAANAPAAGEVTLWAVDYGVLSLTGYQPPNVLAAVYQRKALQVSNEDSRQRIISRRVLTPKGESDGGGGGEGALTARQDLRPLAFWLGSVETDARGRATREVTLPEALTTYRIMAVAADRASRFGSSTAEVTVTKPITLTSAFPRFITLGDRASIGTMVANTQTTGGDAVVTIRSLTPALLDFGTSTTQTIALGAKATEAVRFNATARGIGTARVQVSVRLGNQTDAFESSIPVTSLNPLETSAAFGDTAGARTSTPITVPAGIVPGLGGLQIDLASTALVGLGEGARYLADYGFACAEQKTSAALALALAADLGDAFQMGRIAPRDYRAKATTLLAELPAFQCGDGGFGYWPGGCLYGNAYLTAYILHVMKTVSGVGITVPSDVVARAVAFLDEETKRAEPQQVQWLPMWSASQAFAVRVLVEYGRNQDSNINRLAQLPDRLPVFALSYLADAMAESTSRNPRYADVIRRLGNGLRVEGDQAFVQEVEDDSLYWIWNSNARSTAIVLDGLSRRGDLPDQVPRLVRWLLAARKDGRWRNTQENATALEALVHYYKAFERDVPDMKASVAIGTTTIAAATLRGRSSVAQQVRLTMPELARQVAAGAERDLVFERTGTGHLYYTARVQFALTSPLPALDQGIRVERRYERYVENGSSPAATAFDAGDLIRVTLTVTLPKERRYVAVLDPLPAGVEAVDGWFRTTATDLARDSSSSGDGGSWIERYRRGGFDHVEKYDDRVALFATRLSEGQHEFSYLVRATTAGTFRASGTRAEEMYAPEVNGRADVVEVVIR